MKTIVNVVLIMLVVLMVSAVVLENLAMLARFDAGTDRIRAATTYRRAAVVKDCLENGSAVAVWVVTEDKAWHIVPKVHRPWALAIVEGQETTLPASFELWTIASSGKDMKLKTWELLNGWPAVKIGVTTFSGTWFAAVR